MGAENRHHPPRPCPRETLLPCRHAASPRPSMGGRPLQGHVQPVWPKAKVGRAERGGCDPLLWPRALRSKATPAGRAGLRAGGGGGEIPEPGTADAPLPGEGEGAPFRLEVGCQCNSKGGRPCVVPRGPISQPAHLHGLRRSVLPPRSPLILRPGPGTDGGCSRWNV